MSNKVGKLSRDSNVEFANLHCSNIDKKNIKKINNNKKIMHYPRFEPGSHRFQVHLDIHHAMEANACSKLK